MVSNNKKIYGAFLLMIGCAYYMYFMPKHTSKIRMYTGDSFIVPPQCKHIGLLGCTPHPTDYLRDKKDPLALLNTICLSDFLDIEYLHDSFKRTFVLCKEQKIDHLLIAYLPIYYSGMRHLLNDRFIEGCSLFLQQIPKEVLLILERTAKEELYEGNVTLIVPPTYQLARVPGIISDIDERIRYLAKQFPRLIRTKHSTLSTASIINNRGSDAESDKLVGYFKYEYLFEKPITFKQCSLDKDRFHQPCK